MQLRKHSVDDGLKLAVLTIALFLLFTFAAYLASDRISLVVTGAGPKDAGWWSAYGQVLGFTASAAVGLAGAILAIKLARSALRQADLTEERELSAAAAEEARGAVGLLAELSLRLYGTFRAMDALAAVVPDACDAAWRRTPVVEGTPGVAGIGRDGRIVLPPEAEETFHAALEDSMEALHASLGALRDALALTIANGTTRGLITKRLETLEGLSAPERRPEFVLDAITSLELSSRGRTASRSMLTVLPLWPLRTGNMPSDAVDNVHGFPRVMKVNFPPQVLRPLGFVTGDLFGDHPFAFFLGLRDRSPLDGADWREAEDALGKYRGEQVPLSIADSTSLPSGTRWFEATVEALLRGIHLNIENAHCYSQTDYEQLFALYFVTSNDEAETAPPANDSTRKYPTLPPAMTGGEEGAKDAAAFRSLRLGDLARALQARLDAWTTQEDFDRAYKSAYVAMLRELLQGFPHRSPMLQMFAAVRLTTLAFDRDAGPRSSGSDVRAIRGLQALCALAHALPSNGEILGGVKKASEDMFVGKAAEVQRKEAVERAIKAVVGDFEPRALLPAHVRELSRLVVGIRSDTTTNAAIGLVLRPWLQGAQPEGAPWLGGDDGYYYFEALLCPPLPRNMPSSGGVS